MKALLFILSFTSLFALDRVESFDQDIKKMYNYIKVLELENSQLNENIKKPRTIKIKKVVEIREVVKVKEVIKIKEVVIEKPCLIQNPFPKLLMK